MAAKADRVFGHGNLPAACGEDRKPVAVAKQFVGEGDHMIERGVVRPHAAEDAKDKLDKERRCDEAAVDKMAQHIEMTDVIALKLKPRAVPLAELAFVNGS